MKNGTVPSEALATLGEFKDVIATVAQAVPNDLSHRLALYVQKHKGTLVHDVFQLFHRLETEMFREEMRPWEGQIHRCDECGRAITVSAAKHGALLETNIVEVHGNGRRLGVTRVISFPCRFGDCDGAVIVAKEKIG